MADKLVHIHHDLLGYVPRPLYGDGEIHICSPSGLIGQIEVFA